MFSINFTFLLLALSPIATLAAPRPHPEITSYTLPGNNTFPEGVSRQPNSPYFYSGSITTGTLYRGNIYTPEMEVFIPNTPSTCLAGIKVDDQYRLYVAGCTSGSVFVYDVNTRDLLYTFTVSYNGSFLNDLAIADDGSVYISDSYLPYLLYITPDQLAAEEKEQELKVYTKLDAVIPYTYAAGVSVGNGIAVTKEQEYVILGSWEGRAIYRISLDDSKEISPIDLGGKTVYIFYFLVRVIYT
jgi:sugar lactone lactonase YvrE